LNVRIATAVAVLFALAIGGCRQNESGPILSHGRPVAYWVEQLKLADPKARKKAVAALGHVGTADRAVLPALIAAVKDRDASVRDEAVLALLRIGPDALDARSVLLEAERDSDRRVREDARKALDRIQSKS
jgi:HEAT repeat protein